MALTEGRRILSSRGEAVASGVDMFFANLLYGHSLFFTNVLYGDGVGVLPLHINQQDFPFLIFNDYCVSMYLYVCISVCVQMYMWVPLEYQESC